MFAIVGILALIVSAPDTVRGGNADLEIHVTPRGLDHNEKRQADGSATDAKEHWLYDVTIENKTFKELRDLEVNYIVFFTQEKFGSKDAPGLKRMKGKLSLPSLQPHEKKNLATEAVEITKHHLAGGWVYTSGAKPKADDALGGLWVRVMQGGQQFSEYANPSTLLKEKWE